MLINEKSEGKSQNRNRANTELYKKIERGSSAIEHPLLLGQTRRVLKTEKSVDNSVVYYGLIIDMKKFAALDLAEYCISWLDRCDDRRTYKMMTSIVTVNNFVLSNCQLLALFSKGVPWVSNQLRNKTPSACDEGILLHE